MSGRIEVYTGEMFSGKTSKLIEDVLIARAKNQQVLVFKPEADTRNEQEDTQIARIVSHDGSYIDNVIVLENSSDIFSWVGPGIDMVAIDEVQFLDAGIVPVVEKLAKQGLFILVAGLDCNYRGEPFRFMPDLLVIADNVNKQHGTCYKCGEQAVLTQRLVNGEPAPYYDRECRVGGKELYQPVCRVHHEVRDKFIELKRPQTLIPGYSYILITPGKNGFEIVQFDEYGNSAETVKITRDKRSSETWSRNYIFEWPANRNETW